MKRKLNEDDVPTPVVGTNNKPADNASTFEALNLDLRLLQAISKQSYTKPTPVQAQTIPIALDGRDVLARARTGSGKTAAYVLPALQSILRQKGSKPTEKAVRALFLVPTTELAEQVSRVTMDFCAFCAKDVRVLNLNKQTSEQVQRSLLAEYPEIVVATPAKVWTNTCSGAMRLESLIFLVIDEADLVLSYGHNQDLQNIARSLSDGVQTILTSATMSDDVDKLTKEFCKDPAILFLDDTEDDKSKVTQYVTKCGEDEKFLFLFVIMKLKLVKGKTIIFVEDIDRCYRVKLYLEQFGVRSCVLNSELPVNSRIHVVEEFNKGVYDIIIASDEHEVTGAGLRQVLVGTTGETGGPKIASGDGIEFEEAGEASLEPKMKKRKGLKRDKEYGISRGIDFKNVACILNFDLPRSSKSYTHRIGRTARAGKSGMALSFIVPRELYRKNKYVSVASTQHDEEVLGTIIKHQSKKGAKVENYPFDPSKVEGFRYRTADALRAVSSVAIREARTKELRNELIKSDKLKRHFEENPDDLHHLRHDHELKAARVQEHLKHVPDYLMPDGGAKAVGGQLGFVGLGKTSENRIRRNRKINRAKGKGRIASTKRSDPLKTFNAKGRGKK